MNATLNGCLHGQTDVGCAPNKPLPSPEATAVTPREPRSHEERMWLVNYQSYKS